MNGPDLRMHVLAIVALGVNLWIGGELIYEWVGPVGRTVFEMTLIFAYMVIVLGMGAPFRFWERPGSGEDDQDQGGPRTS